MPLTKSKSKEAFKSNLKAELASGKPRDQSLAIAYRIQREAKAFGGSVGRTSFSIPKVPKLSGFIDGATAGREDRVPAKVSSNSYVIPSDVVSAIGQGNSLAGARALNQLFNMGPYHTARPSIHGGKSPRSGKKMFADGGVSENPTTEIVISDGEFSIPPETIAEIGGGDISHGHDILDSFVKHVRQKAIKTLKRLPKPKKS